MKTVYIEGANVHIFWTTWEIPMKFSGKKWHDIIKSHKKAGLHPLRRKYYFLEKPQERELTPSSLFRVNFLINSFC